MNILKFKLGERSYEESARLRAKLSQWLGRPSGQLAGTFVTEMADLRKVLYLCNGCHTGFSERQHQYRRAARPPLNRGCIATCDGCREWGDCEIYLPEERY